MGSPRPLLILSDSPSCSSGLGRITRELALRIHENIPELRVGTVGYGGSGDRNLPFPQYYAECKDWMPLDLPNIWRNFCGDDENGILFSIWDLARLGWLGWAENPEFRNNHLSQWAQANKIERWCYAPIDAEGPNGKLSYPLKETLLGFDRVLLYSEWSKRIVENSGVANTQAIPHGIDSTVFFPRHHENSRVLFGSNIIGKPWHVQTDQYLIGIVATNQPRKDWHLAVQTAAILRDKYGKNVWLWLHTDVLERFWSIPTLLVDYGFLGASRDTVFVTTGDLSDEQMAWGYSACDVTLGIGRGEGFGLPLAESLACGTPVIHGAYGGAFDWMPKPFLVHPCAYNHEGLYGEKRPVFCASAWAEAAVNARREDAKLPPCLEWKTLWSEFEKWFRGGLL
jgi:glycosyltransferase involved in cell wall biosynthesis